MTGYQYVVLRCVPRVDREEFVNVGVIVYCQSNDFLRSASRVDHARLTALGGEELDVDDVTDALDAIEAVCVGDGPDGSPAREPIGVRFGFVSAPRSTVVQPGPIHGGVADNPERELAALLERLVG